MKATAIFATVFCLSCGTQAKVPTDKLETETPSNAYAVKTSDDLPICDVKRLGQLFYIESEAVFARLGARVKRTLYPGMGHAVSDDEIAEVQRIVNQVLE